MLTLLGHPHGTDDFLTSLWGRHHCRSEEGEKIGLESDGLILGEVGSGE